MTLPAGNDLEVHAQGVERREKTRGDELRFPNTHRNRERFTPSWP
jgi:hypothetical protein